MPHLGEDLALFWTMFGFRLEHATYLHLFSRTRRMRRDPTKAMLLPDPVREATGLPLGDEAGYFTGATGHAGQGHDDSILDYNRPPKGQPGLWCQWVPNVAHTAIAWSGGEKFYSYTEWLDYLMRHFLRPWGYVVNGSVEWAGENETDRGVIHVRNNTIEVEDHG